MRLAQVSPVIVCVDQPPWVARRFPRGRCVFFVLVVEASDENHEAPPQVEVGEEVRPAGDSARRPRLVGHLVSGGSSRREA